LLHFWPVQLARMDLARARRYGATRSPKYEHRIDRVRWPRDIL